MNKDRNKVYEKFEGHCAYCGTPIDISVMQVDHIKPKRMGGKDEIENYNPSCRRCNHYKRALDLEVFRGMMKTLHERLMKNYIFKVAMDFGIVRINKFDGIFYFEKKSKEEQE